MVATDIPPRQPYLRDDAVVAAVERQIVKHDVAGSDAESGFDADQIVDDVVSDIVDLGLAFRLRIGEEHDVEGFWLFPPDQREVDGGRQRTCRF